MTTHLVSRCASRGLFPRKWCYSLAPLFPENVTGERRAIQSKKKRFQKMEIRQMDRSAFWHLIEITKEEKHSDQEKQITFLRERLFHLPLEELQSFTQIVDGLLYESYRPLLWAAAYLMNGGCSDDGFEYFRGWLIAQGATVFSKALNDPDTLADVIPSHQRDFLESDFECEEILYVARNVYHEKTGEDMPPSSHLGYPSLTTEEINLITDDIAVAQTCPSLWTLFGEEPHSFA
jgi:Protein of unknown function (DUF4240)